MKGGDLIRLLFRRRRRRSEAIEALTYTPTEELVERRAELQAAAQAAGLTAHEIDVVLNAHPELPRPLLPIERETLLTILGYADFEGRDELLAQVDSAMVDGYAGCGCATVSLVVKPDAPRAPTAPSPVPNFAGVFDAEGEEIGGILIFLLDGYLAHLEIYDYFQESHGISPFPPIDQLKIVR